MRKKHAEDLGYNDIEFPRAAWVFCPTFGVRPGPEAATISVPAPASSSPSRCWAHGATSTVEVWKSRCSTSTDARTGRSRPSGSQ